MRKLTTALLVLVTVVVVAVAAAITFGGPTQPAPMQSVSDSFKGVDLSGLPPIQKYGARDGTQLAYRIYRPAAGAFNGSVVLVHGSSAQSISIHPLATGFSHAGYVAYALAVRGHGEPGERGHVTYIGQLEDDLEDFMKATRPRERRVSLASRLAGGSLCASLRTHDKACSTTTCFCRRSLVRMRALIVQTVVAGCPWVYREYWRSLSSMG